MNDAIIAVQTLKNFMSKTQFDVMREGLRGKESQHFQHKFVEYSERIAYMPKSYGQAGLRERAIAYLHYFRGNSHWYIIEKDAETPNSPGQHQAFGLTKPGKSFSGPDAELGYISIVELTANGVELDLYFTPCALKNVTPGSQP